MKVRYIGADDAQVNWAGKDDPRKHLAKGHTYNVLFKDVHSWSTTYELEEFPGLNFNSVCFEDLTETQKMSFEDYWKSTGITHPVGVMEEAFKEIARKAWFAAKTNL